MSSPTIQSASTVRSVTYVVTLAMVAAISGLLFGFDTAVINGALVFLRRQFALSDFHTEIAASSLLVGCLLGAVGASALSDRTGRKRSLLAAALLFAASSIGAALATGLVEFCAARIAGGLAIGLASALTPVYISEISPSEMRGRIVSLNQLAIVIGILVAYFTNWRLSFLGDSSWRWMFAVGVIPSVALLLGLLFIPESPRWLLAHGLHQEGLEVLQRVSPRPDRLATEILQEVQAEYGSSRELFGPSLRPRLVVAVLLATFQQISGINAVLYYGSVIFTERFTGASASAALGANVSIGVVNLVCTVLAMIAIDRIGRRSLLLISSGGMTLTLALLSLALVKSLAPAIAFASVLLYVAVFAIGLGPGVWVYMAEIFPTKYRGRAMSIATSALWASCLAVTLTFLSILRAIGMPGVFAIYAVLSLVTLVFVWRWVPETRGRSLEDIHRTWSC
jgi:sugar porter (SP) family MFS transporter